MLYFDRRTSFCGFRFVKIVIYYHYMAQRIIAHLDLDAFFASVEERETPWMAGKPVVVGSDPLEGKGRGVVSTANYLARAYGIRSALPISKAWHFSQDAGRRGLPEAIFVTPDFRKYSKASRAVMEIIRKYSAVVEQASVDEAYIDLSNYKSFVQAEEDMQKPDGLTIILPKDSEKFLAPLSIRKIPGIGPKTEQSFNAQKIFKVEDLKKYSLAELEEMLGKWGTALYYKIRGLDDSAVSEEYEAKSIGEQETFLEDTLDFKTVMEKMEILCQGVFRSFQASDFKSFKNVTITARFADFETKTRSHTLKKTEKTLKAIKVEAMRLLMPFFDSRENPRRKKIRLVGVRLEKLA